uniref:Non-specific lipid-transfer protein-like protein At2g13820 n=1 Tax=Tanacetum cinerariifolium TaxID=118510 RepID=A0A6L2MEL6_TANCI|nr:non-specific lipid-transfer protein-like protein At2g13820 [Tanacetum cinerariifolium]GEX76212.1 non-specific lipid-transfer protein-like protein At2g13820 [Tanacetum cinerariifolium]
MASSKFEVFGLVLVLLWGVTMAQSGCNAALVSMSPCLSYVTGNSSTPTTTCCTQLANVVQSQPRCLCVFTGDGSGAPTGMNINQTLALALPSACNIQTPPVSRCTEGANGPTSSTPSDTPSSGSGSKTTPGTKGANGPTSSTPSDTPSSGSGSKTTPGTSTGSSNATTKNLPFYATFVLLFIATLFSSYTIA